MVTKIISYKTSDGKVFESESMAEMHEHHLWQVKVANECLDAGGSIADCLRVADHDIAISPILEKVTKDTKLVISYWQCKDTPGYQPVRFELGLCIWVGGDVGAWSGPYGSAISLRELAQYASDSRTIF